MGPTPSRSMHWLHQSRSEVEPISVAIRSKR
jgi:hypothetical protein